VCVSVGCQGLGGRLLLGRLLCELRKLHERASACGRVARRPCGCGALPGNDILLGDAKSSLGDAESSLGDAESSLGDAASSLGDAESSLGDAKSSLGDA
jgi:hypothetical protein